MPHIVHRPCVVCGKGLTPFEPQTLTSHEYQCYKKRPDLVPDYHKAGYIKDLMWEKRSNAAKKAWATRRGR